MLNDTLRLFSTDRLSAQIRSSTVVSLAITAIDGFAIFSCFDQFLCMAFAQLTYRESLREHRDLALHALHQKLYHASFRGVIARSTLADANEHRDWRIYADFARDVLIARAAAVPESRWLRQPNSKQTAYMARIPRPSTFCLTLFPLGAFPSPQGCDQAAHAHRPAPGISLVSCGLPTARPTTSPSWKQYVTHFNVLRSVTYCWCSIHAISWDAVFRRALRRARARRCCSAAGPARLRVVRDRRERGFELAARAQQFAAPRAP